MPIEIGISTTVGGIAGNTPGGTPTPPPFSNLNSFSFDGVDDYFMVPDTSGLSFGNGTTDSPFSFSTWIKMTDATRFFVLSKGSVFSTNYEYLLNTNASDKLGLFLYDSSNNSRIGRLYNTALTSYENQWVHICSTYNGSGLSSGIKVYLNGVRVDDTDSNSGTYVAMESSNKMLNIGRTETGGYANGLTDETAIFNSELSASDVLAIYNNGEPQSLDAYSPLVWFRMGDNATWNGTSWTMTSVGTDTRVARSMNMVEANRTTDVPPNPFANTQSISLDGVDDYVEVADADNLSFGNGTTDSPFSISTWWKMDNSNGFRGVQKYSTSYEYRINTIGSSGILKCQLYDNSNTVYIGQQSNVGLSSYVGQWIHVTMTYDGSSLSSGIKLYLNGSLLASTDDSNGSYTAMHNTTSVFRLGHLSGNYANGLIDETAIFNSELSQSEVTSIYGDGSPSSLSSISGLVSWWRFEGSGTTATDSGSGGNNGTLINGVVRSTDVPLFNTKSISLDGVDDFVEAKSTTLGLNTAISISLWVKTTQSTSGFKQLIGEYDWGNSSKRNWILYLSNSGNKLAFLLYNSLGQAVINKNVPATDANIDDGNWHHVMVTWDGTTNTNSFNMFFDGVNVEQATPSVTGIRTSDTPLLIADGTSGNVEFEGNIDEVAVWDSAINISDVWDGSGVPFDISSSNPLSWWRCGDGDTAPTLTDNGSGGNDGTMTNFSTFSTDVPTIFSNTKSIALDGVDDYVDTNFNADNFSSLSVSGWIKATNPQADYNVIISNHYRNDTTPYFQFVCRIDNNGKLTYRIGNTLGNVFSISSTTTIRDNSWHHFVGTYNGSNIKVYIDGTLENTLTASGNLYSTGNKTSIGAVIDVTSGSEVINNNFLGNIDEVSIFNSELSASDVTTIYNGGVPNDISSLNPISWWRCGDGDTSPTLTDNGSASNDGTMTNFSTFSTDVPT